MTRPSKNIETPSDAPRAEETRPIRLGRERAALVVYRVIRGEPRFLLISSARNPDKLTLPGGKIDSDESPATAAMRETTEEAGVMTDVPVALGRYLHHKRKRRVYPTQTFLARFAGSTRDREDRTRLWLSLDELADPAYQVRKPIRKQLKRAARELSTRRVAA